MLLPRARFFPPPMKIKKSEYAIIKALSESKLGYGAIGKQLGLKKSTVAKHIQKERLIASIGPKVKLDRSFANGRIPLRIKHFLQDNPGDIKLAQKLIFQPTLLVDIFKKLAMNDK